MPDERALIYSMSMSTDGYIAGPDGSFDWGAPSDELHRFHNDRVRELGVHLLGRKLYETMLYWETSDQNPEQDEIGREFASIWNPLPKLVFSSTLDSVEAQNAELAMADLATEIARLKSEPGKDLGIGGATLAAEAMRLGLIDVYDVFVCPVVVGGGTPFFPPLDTQIDLELVDTRSFEGGVIHMRYRAA